MYMIFYERAKRASSSESPVCGALRGASERPSDALVLGPHRRRCGVLGLRDTGGAIIGMCVALQNGLQVESGPS